MPYIEFCLHFFAEPALLLTIIPYSNNSGRLQLESPRFVGCRDFSAMDQTELFKATVRTIRLRMRKEGVSSSSLSSSILPKSSRKDTAFTKQAKEVVSFHLSAFICMQVLTPINFMTLRGKNLSELPCLVLHASYQ